MKNNTFAMTFVLSLFLLGNSKLAQAENKHDTYFFENYASTNTIKKDSVFYVTISGFESFFKKYSKFKKYRTTTETLYKNRNYSPIWYDDRSIDELGHLLYAKFQSMDTDFGLKNNIPYKDEIDRLFNETSSVKPSKMNAEILLTCMYIYYADKVYDGLDEKKVKELGWYLPKKEISYEKILDSLLIQPNLLNEKNSILFSQYYKLEEALKKYKAIEKKNDWPLIHIDSIYKEYKPFDSATTIAQVRNRLYVIGDLKEDSKKTLYDEEMMAGVLNYKKRHGLKLNYTLAPEHLRLLNKPVEKLIETIMVNMERCRWIPAALEQQKKYVMINIPSFRLIYVKDGKYELESNVFVGTRMNETVIFSGNIDRIVFSPYWYIPSSIIENELKFKVAQDPNYLEEQNIEVKKGIYRQKPGPDNSLGLVKFLFPNPNDIYMHDTPKKSLFTFESRTFSHGCINVEKAKELAVRLLEDDPKWPVDKITEAMNGGEEVPYKLTNTVPIYIGYFTSWVNDDGEISFFTDIYDRDTRLYNLLYNEDEI